MEQVIRLLEENNRMLKEILTFLQQFQSCDDMRQFSISVAADLFVEMLEDNKELKEQIKSNFKL